jgi:hypothetical protein
MSRNLWTVIAAVAVIVAMTVIMKLVPPAAVASADPPAGGAAKAGPAPKTTWGDPDLQGIWTSKYQTPLERPAKYANKLTLTEEERADLDQVRAKSARRDTRAQRGTESDVAGAYNAVFQSMKATGPRTSLIVDPPDGRIPAFTPEARRRLNEIREFEVMTIQATETCRTRQTECADWKYAPPSPRMYEVPPHYNTKNLNRVDGPEDRAMTERCMVAVLPDFGGFRRIVQTAQAVAIFYDVGQGQGWQRVIPITTKPHLPSHVRQWWGDSRGRWEGNTLVVDVTNFSPKSDFAGSRENLHLVERWTRLDTNTIEYAVTIEDPTTWTKPWTVTQEMGKLDDPTNRIYTEPRCHEGNYGLMTMLVGARADEKAFAERRGPHPATRDTTKLGFGDAQDELAAGGPTNPARTISIER